MINGSLLHSVDEAAGIDPLCIPQDAEGSRTHGLAWYACYTKARNEKKVDAQLRQRGFESYLPLIPQIRQWSDRRKRTEFPLFPGYVFTRAPSTLLGQILGTPGVAAIVRFGSRPVLIPDDEIINIARFARALATTDLRPPRVRLYEGQRVRIIAGPFAGVHGVVREVRGRTRVLIGLATIGLGFEIDVPVDAVKPLSRV